MGWGDCLLLIGESDPGHEKSHISHLLSSVQQCYPSIGQPTPPTELSSDIQKIYYCLENPFFSCLFPNTIQTVQCRHSAHT